MAPTVWLITGSSSGMGRTMTEIVASNGDIAVATLRKPEAIADLVAKYGDKVCPVRLDVTKPNEIKEAFNKAVEKFGRIDVVFNNAGYSLLGDVETTPDDYGRNSFETNFWGSLNVAREAIRTFREVNKPIGGRLITTTSIVATVTSAGLGMYGAAKHAIAGALEAMKKELDPEWNIKFTIVMPGAFNTRGASPESLAQTPPHPAYDFPGSPTVHMRHLIPGVDIPGDTHKAMKVIFDHIATAENPPIRLPLGKDAVVAFRAYSDALANDAKTTEHFSQDLLREGKELMDHLDEQ
ncbi:NAD(P)-binding protein [Phlegmacium glaucopus]|nr:NAD(P)-binding protein [Phlegmacium glaucopus]